MQRYKHQKELIEAVEGSKWLIEGLLKVMLEDSVGATQEDRETIVNAGVKVISDILDTKIIKKQTIVDKEYN